MRNLYAHITTQKEAQQMSKKLLVGLIVAFVLAAALPLTMQAQTTVGTIPRVMNCKYVGPADPLSLNTVSFGNGDDRGYTKTVKVQKEIFYCYDSYSNIPDDKTLQDPLLNRDKIGKGLRYIVEIEIFAFIAEEITDGNPIKVTPAKDFQVVRCVKERRTPTHQPGQASTMLETWVLAGCEYWQELGTKPNNVPGLPTFAARGCVPEYTIPTPGGRGQKVTTKQPFVHGPIPVEDPIETNTVLVDYDNNGVPNWIKTVNVNKEVFRCAFSADPTYPRDRPAGDIGEIRSGPVIWDIEIYTEEIERVLDANGDVDFDDDSGFKVVYKNFKVAYCAKYEPWAMLMGCAFEAPNVNPFMESASTTDVLAMARPFISLRSVGLRQGAGQYVFEAQGYNIEGVQVQVYSLAGKQVFSAETAGNSLSWNGLSSDGRQLANGVYLYVMTVKGTYGDVVQTKVQKLAILR